MGTRNRTDQNITPRPIREVKTIEPVAKATATIPSKPITIQRAFRSLSDGR